MIKRVYEAAEGLIFDATMAVMIPTLIWWTNYGLKREDLSDELKEFWQQLKEEV